MLHWTRNDPYSALDWRRRSEEESCHWELHGALYIQWSFCSRPNRLLQSDRPERVRIEGKHTQIRWTTDRGIGLVTPSVESTPKYSFLLLPYNREFPLGKQSIRLSWTSSRPTIEEWWELPKIRVERWIPRPLLNLHPSKYTRLFNRSFQFWHQSTEVKTRKRMSNSIEALT